MVVRHRISRAAVVRGLGAVIGGLALGLLVRAGTETVGLVPTLVVFWLVMTAVCVAVVFKRARRLGRPPSAAMLLSPRGPRRAQRR